MKLPAVQGRFRGKRVGVLAGGLSSEREISDRSARAATKVLTARGYDVAEIAVDRDIAGALAKEGVEVAFNALHGRYGEDGCVQGLLEVLGIPYTGAGVLGSALSMDKWLSKGVLDRAGMQTAPAVLVGAGETAAWEREYPVVVKPRGEGSSNGVSLVREPAGLAAAVAEARLFDTDVLIEDFIPGQEITVAILEDCALSAMEVVALGDDFHTYEVKYTAGREEFILPAPLGDGYEPVLEFALESHRALLAGAYSRVDLRVRPDGEMFILEVNTLPGLHELGWFPAMAAHVGIGFGDLIELLLDRAELGVRETRMEVGG
ncbi:MAG: D-alanine--D-alanine ligase [Candidatus Binatia bacterium]|nr:D-alanine--D-alanine ligase [Candidatus Binatia bacterium]